MRAAARQALHEGAASLRVSSVRREHGPGADYDCPVVILEPANPAAARVAVEVQDGPTWMLMAGGGPPYEFFGSTEDWEPRLSALVRCVVTGQYEHRWEAHQRPRLLWWSGGLRYALVARYGSGPDAVTTTHWRTPDERPDLTPVRFDAYL